MNRLICVHSQSERGVRERKMISSFYKCKSSAYACMSRPVGKVRPGSQTRLECDEATIKNRLNQVDFCTLLCFVGCNKVTGFDVHELGLRLEDFVKTHRPRTTGVSKNNKRDRL